MFLVQITETEFIDAEKIEYVKFDEGINIFMVGRCDGQYRVTKKLELSFIHQLQTCNNNPYRPFQRPLIEDNKMKEE